MELRHASVILPPLLLVIVGTAAYITVEKLTAPKVVTLRATGSSPVIQASSGATQTGGQGGGESGPTASPINTDVPPTTQAQAAALQAKVALGEDTWRLDPLQTAQHEGSDYGFSDQDTFNLASGTSSSSGTNQQTVMANHGGQTYQITLTQPGTTGSTGVWVIQSITTAQ